MTRARVFILALLLSYVQTTVAQLSPEVKAKVTKALAIKIPEHEAEGSAFRYLQLTDSFSRAGHITMAGFCFDHVNPYHLLFLNYTPATIPVLYKRLKLSDSFIQRYNQKFTTAYYGHKTASYDSFKKYYGVIQTLKARLDTAKGLALKKISRQLIAADTAHAAFLLHYIDKNGWPSIENGSLFAAALAIRHIDNWYNYLPPMFDAFQKGQVQSSQLNKVRANKPYDFDYLEYKKLMLSDAYEWDISTWLTGAFSGADDAKSILQKLKAQCPDYQVYIVQLIPANKKPTDYLSNNGNRNFQRLFWQFFQDVIDACPQLHPGPRRTMGTNLTLPAETNEETLKMYITTKSFN